MVSQTSPVRLLLPARVVMRQAPNRIPILADHVFRLFKSRATWTQPMSLCLGRYRVKTSKYQHMTFPTLVRPSQETG